MSTHSPGAGEEGQSHRPRRAAVPRRQDHAVRRVRAQRHLRTHRRGVLGDGRRRVAGGEALGDRLLQQEPGVLPRQLPWLQRRPRPDALGGDRRHAGQREADRNRRQRRRRYGRDRDRPVRAPDAAQRADDLHHRGQRLLRADERTVLADGRPRLEAEERRRQRPAAARYLRAGRSSWAPPSSRGRSRGQEAALRHSQGGRRAPRHGHDRRPVPLRDLQRPRRLHQELQPT
jgi:hypothetical protein